MLAWLSKNIATIIICLVLAVIVALIIFSLVKIRKRQILLRLQLCPLCYGRLLPQRESAKGQKAQLISTTEQKKDAAQTASFLHIPVDFPRFADIIKENRSYRRCKT